VALRLRRREQVVDLEDEQGLPRRYVVREMTGLERDQFVQATEARTRRDPAGKVTSRTSEGLSQLLLSLALRDETGVAVARATLDGWPTTTVEALAEVALTLSGFREDGAPPGN